MKVGDRVKFISDTGVGHIVKLYGSMADVDVEDGFVVPYSITELVVVQQEDEIAAMKSIGVDDARPGGKKKAKTLQPTKKKAVDTRNEPAYAKYGKISIISDYRDEDDDSDDDFDDSYLDLNKFNEIYLRNKIAAEEKEREFEVIRLRQERAKSLVTESSAPIIGVEVSKIEKDKLESVTLSELSDKIAADMPKKEPIPKKAIEKNSGLEVIDLHIEIIIDSHKNMTSGEIITAQLARFTISLDGAIKSGVHGKIVFIHGVGSGRLKLEMQKILKSNYTKLRSQDASFKEYGYGAMMIFY